MRETIAENLTIGDVILDLGEVLEIKYTGVSVVLKVALATGNERYFRWRKSKKVILDTPGR